tara:strand:- start:35 stop:1447 length:1413 start_codon:yes stop_codon:yes gene_type:complete
MCGIGAVIHKDINCNINKLLYEILFNLQHRGQDSSGFVIYNKLNKTNIIKEYGLVDKTMEKLINTTGYSGLGHVRYQTSGTKNYNEIQPFYDNIFDGISLVHNGNLVNIAELTMFCLENNIILDTSSDSEILFKIFIFYLKQYLDFDSDSDSNSDSNITNHIIKNIVEKIYNLCKGSYSVIVMINNYGIITFRDIYGIRPLVYTIENNYIAIASETIAFENDSNYKNINNGDVVIIRNIKNNLNINIENICNYPLVPCLFEYIYFARPESYINDILVYEYREKIAKEIIKVVKKIKNKIDCVVPVPQTGIITANKIAKKLNKKLKFAIIKNRYTHRTFIDRNKDKIVEKIKKIKIINKLVNNKNLLVVDDSIVRGNTSKTIVEALKNNNANDIYFISCCPPIKYPNKYGISIATFDELIANKKTNKEIQKEINVKKLFFLDLKVITKVLNRLNPKIKNFETSVFTGNYIL